MSFLEDFHDLRDTREERQRQDPAAFHRPFTYQEPFHASAAKERWFVAGNRSGKTLSGAYEVVRLITGQVDWWHGPPGEVW